MVFIFGILDARFELTFTKKLSNVSMMEVIFVIIYLFKKREFGYVLLLDFSVASGFIPY